MDKIQFRRDTLANWASANPILAEGEIGYVLDDPNRYKMGDGVKTWDQLPFRGFDGNIVHEEGTNETSVMSQSAVTKMADGIRSKLSRHIRIEEKTAYSILNIEGIGAELVVVNYGVPIIVANNREMEGRIDIPKNGIKIMDSDKFHIQTGATEGNVDFKVISLSEFDASLSESSIEKAHKLYNITENDFRAQIGTVLEKGKKYIIKTDLTELSGDNKVLYISAHTSTDGYLTDNYVVVPSTGKGEVIYSMYTPTADVRAWYIVANGTGNITITVYSVVNNEWDSVIKTQKYSTQRVELEVEGTYQFLLYREIPEESLVINRGITIAIADNSNLDNRVDVRSGDIVYFENKKSHIQTLTEVGKVDYEILHFPKKSILNPLLAENSVRPENVTFIKSVNLVSEIKVGKYFAGQWYNDNPNYDATGKIPVEPGKSYCWNTTTRFVHTLDINGTKIREIEYLKAGESVKIDDGEAFIVVTFSATNEKKYQVEEGVTPSLYKSPDIKTIQKEFLPNQYSTQLTFKSFTKKEVVLPSSMLYNTEINMCKNIVMSALVQGKIESVTMGVAFNGYYGKNITLNKTEIIVRGGTNNGTYGTYQHGISINNFAVLEISKGNDSEAIIRLTNDKGDRYEVAITWSTSVGQPFFKNDSSSDLNVTFNFMPRDINQAIWMFGDSYFGMYDTSRWPYYILTSGYNQFLLDARGGESAHQGLSDFENLLSLGARPKYVVWCHGVNGGRDESSGPNSSWLNATKRMIALCESHGITPVLATIPSCPDEIHVNMNEWIRSSGYRYIDFANAVENEGTLYWKGWDTSDALLSSDKVHPSVKGAAVLAAQVIADFPEISISI